MGEFVEHTSSTMLIKIVFSIAVIFPIVSGLPQDIDCFEANFPPKLQSSIDNSSVQWIKIEQVLQFFARVNGTSESNETSVFTTSFGLRPEENITYYYDIDSQGNTKQKRQLSLGYNGRGIYGAIGFHSVQNVSNNISESWSCQLINKTAPYRTKLKFSEKIDLEVNQSLTMMTEFLQVDLIQSDYSCFEENFPEENMRNKREEKDCEERIKQAVEIIQTYYDNVEEIEKFTTEVMLQKGVLKKIELTSFATDVLNPRYLILLFDGKHIKASINNIKQEYASRSKCQIFNGSAPETWITQFGENFTSDDSVDLREFVYRYDKLRLNFLDPKIPWENSNQDQQCFNIQFNSCKDKSKDTISTNVTLYVTHYMQHYPLFLYPNKNEVVQKFTVNFTDEFIKEVKLNYNSDSLSLPDTGPRNLSLKLEGSTVKIGMAQLKRSSLNLDPVWTCNNSSVAMEVSSNSDAEFLFYDTRFTTDQNRTMRHKEFLSFSWSSATSVAFDRPSLTIALCFMLLFTTAKQ